MIKKTSLLAIFAAFLFVISPSIVLAEGGEGQCPDSLAYDPPPYIGNLTFTYINACAYITGKIDLAGNSPNELRPPAIEFPPPGVQYECAVTPLQFTSHTPQDIRGRCITTVEGFGIFEVVGAHHLVYLSTTQFSVDVVIMPMRQK